MHASFVGYSVTVNAFLHLSQNHLAIALVFSSQCVSVMIYQRHSFFQDVNHPMRHRIPEMVSVSDPDPLVWMHDFGEINISAENSTYCMNSGVN